MPIIAIASEIMKRYAIDAYVLDVLMPDLVGHDRKPAAFLVYLCLTGASERSGKAAVALSLQEIGVRTGLAKSTVQTAIRHLKRRGLLDPNVVASTSAPIRRVAKPWVR
jgi:DNA-binding MarR family transcriptional regulator